MKLSQINKAFVISLKGRKDRREMFFTNVKKAGLLFDVIEFTAVDGLKCSPASWFTAGPGAWGCYRSHLQILENSLSEGLDNYLVFEDDAEFVEGFADKFSAALELLPDDWDMLYIGGQHWRTEHGKPVCVNEKILKAFNVNRTHAYMISRRGMPVIYRHLNNISGWAGGHHIDHHLGVLHESGIINVYATEPWLVGQAAGQSDICGQRRLQTAFWKGNYMPDSIKITDGVELAFYSVGYGNIGVNGSLGYEGKNIALTGADAWISAHAPARLVLNITEPADGIRVFGAINSDMEPRQSQLLLVDSVPVAAVRGRGRRTVSVPLPAGRHTIEWCSNDNAAAHTVIGLTHNAKDPEDAVLPALDVLCNCTCSRQCPGCNQQAYRDANADYEYSVTDAEYLIKALDKYNRRFNLFFAGGEPALWPEMNEVVKTFRKSDKIGILQVATSEVTEDNVTRLKGLFDRVCCSIRGETEGYLTSCPEWLKDCVLWDQRLHVIDGTETKNINCCCMAQGVVAGLVGKKVWPCTLAANFAVAGLWETGAVTVNDWLSARKKLPAIGSFDVCKKCPNNLTYRNNGRRERT